MPGPVRLEEFESEARSEPAATLDADAFEEARLASFEQGYQAGWDDAAAAQDEDQRRLRADVAHNLQELSFTYHDARGHILRSLAPLLDQICARVVPELAARSIGEIVRETLMPMVEAAADQPVTIVLNPSSRTAVESALADIAAPLFNIAEEPSLGSGQLYLRFDESEQEIDIDAAVATIGAAVEAFFNGTGELREHG
jgi:flagellar biosynthesis/type III secretory pathway protein FliH